MLIMCRSEANFRPANDTATDIELQLPEAVLTQFLSPDDEHNVLETCRVKNKNKYIEKNCASRWSFAKNHYMMHGQQNVKFRLHRLQSTPFQPTTIIRQFLSSHTKFHF